MSQLIAFRALQGIGAGGIHPIALTILGDVFTGEDAREAGPVQRDVGDCRACRPAPRRRDRLRPVVALGVLHQRPGRVLAALVLALFFREQVARRSHKLDFTGAAALTVAIGSVLVGVNLRGARFASAIGLSAAALFASFGSSGAPPNPSYRSTSYEGA